MVDSGEEIFGVFFFFWTQKIFGVHINRWHQVTEVFDILIAGKCRTCIRKSLD